MKNEILSKAMVDENQLQVDIGTKVWLQIGKQGVLGRGRYLLLKAIEKTGSVKKAAIELRVSEKTAHRYIKRMEAALEADLVIRSRGGSHGGGSSKLTPLAQRLLSLFEQANQQARENAGEKLITTDKKMEGNR